MTYPNQVANEGMEVGFCTRGLSCKLIMTSLEYRITVFSSDIEGNLQNYWWIGFSFFKSDSFLRFL